MNRDDALKALGLDRNADQQTIDTTLAKKRAEIERKKADAPTEALQSKFETLLDKLDQAETVLLRDNGGGEAPAREKTGPASLSQTKIADLPQAQMSHTGFTGDSVGAQVHLQPGQVLANRYEIREQIGAGGMGAVYHAYDRTKQEDIALKVLLPALVQSERARQRFLDEARISAKLSHPHIVNVYDVQQDGDFFFLTMELLDGQDLRQLMDARQLARQPFDETEARVLAATLGEALAYAHQYTVHRDIKPENVWVTEGGGYKIMDFGIARVQSTSQRTQTGAAMGTAYYMAPEQLKGTSTIDGRADQYALAVLLYELLTGEVSAGRFKPLRQLRKDLGKGFVAAVEKALETDPDDRFADMAAFTAALQKKGGGISLPEVPWKGVGIAAALLLAVLGGGAAVTSGGFSFDLAGLLPLSAEEKAEKKAAIAKIQGQIKVLKQRLETARRNLDSDVRDAERNNSNELAALRHWQQLTENAIFNGSVIGELEGELAMAETLLREEQFAKADKAFSEVKAGYENLNEQFQAGEKLYAADQSALKAKSDWQAYKKKYGFSGQSPSADQAQRQYDEAQQQERIGELSSALAPYGDAEQSWRSATQDKSVVGHVRGKQQAWAAAAKQEKLQRQEARQAFLDKLGMKFVLIPAGTFPMGSVNGDEEEKPVHSVSIKSFYIQEHEVTFAQWDACVMAGACSHRPDDRGWGRGGRPVIEVSWNDITQDFIPWLNSESGQSFRLPSEAEWEYAARAGKSSKYTWGDSIDCSQARFGYIANRCGKRLHTDLVKSFSPSIWGLYDMHGNVWEWVQDCWNDSYVGAPDNGSAWKSGNCQRRVLRGGSWFDGEEYLRSTKRSADVASLRHDKIGFRLVQSE